MCLIYKSQGVFFYQMRIRGKGKGVQECNISNIIYHHDMHFQAIATSKTHF